MESRDQETRRRNDLVQRTYKFAREVRSFVNGLPRLLSNYDDAKQVARASGSIAANYLEAQEGLSRKDFFYRIRICRKEARETGLWLALIEIGDDSALSAERERLLTEVDELKRIFSAIVSKDDTRTVGTSVDA